MAVKTWIGAFRLRTLPLSLSCIGMGGFLAAAAGKFNGLIFALCCLTTVFLQILSNLANDYGDSVHGADHAARKGPQRAVQSGAITSGQMKAGILGTVLDELERRNKQTALVTLCIGAGMGTATIIERV